MKAPLSCSTHPIDSYVQLDILLLFHSFPQGSGTPLLFRRGAGLEPNEIAPHLTWSDLPPYGYISTSATYVFFVSSNSRSIIWRVGASLKPAIWNQLIVTNMMLIPHQTVGCHHSLETRVASVYRSIMDRSTISCGLGTLAAEH